MNGDEVGHGDNAHSDLVHRADFTDEGWLLCVDSIFSAAASQCVLLKESMNICPTTAKYMLYQAAERLQAELLVKAGSFRFTTN